MEKIKHQKSRVKKITTKKEIKKPKNKSQKIKVESKISIPFPKSPNIEFTDQEMVYVATFFFYHGMSVASALESKGLTFDINILIDKLKTRQDVKQFINDVDVYKLALIEKTINNQKLPVIKA